MSNFVSPLLPQGKVEYIAIGERYFHLIKGYLRNNNVKSINIPDNPLIDKRVCGHVDMSILNYEKGKLFCAEYIERIRKKDILKDYGFEVIYVREAMAENYPHDALLNVCITEKFAIYNPKTAGKEVVKYLTSKMHNNFQHIHCNQGYAKCSVCVVDDYSIITSDKGILKKSREKGIDALLIEDNCIRLSGFSHGFIGGAAFKLCPSILTLTGRFPDSYKQNEIAIRNFLNKRNMELNYASNDIIIDIGGIIPLLEF